MTIQISDEALMKNTFSFYMARFRAIRELKQQQLNNMTEASYIRAIKFERTLILPFF